MTPELRIALEAFNRQRESLLADYPDLTDDDKTLLDMLDGLSDLQNICKRMLRVALLREAMAEGIKEHLDKLKSRQDRLNWGAERIRDMVQSAMNEAGIASLKADFTATLSPRKPSVIITNSNEIPPAFMRIKSEPDKALIKSAIDRGETVPGTTMSNTGKTLTVRTN